MIRQVHLSMSEQARPTNVTKWFLCFNISLHSPFCFLCAYRTVNLSASWEELTVPQLVKKSRAFYRTWRLSTASTDHHWSLPWATWIHSISYQPIHFRYIWILSTHPCLGHSQSLFPSGYCTKILCAFPFSPQHTTCTTYLTLLIPLHTKRRPLYLKPQSVPRCKHFSSRL